MFVPTVEGQDAYALQRYQPVKRLGKASTKQGFGHRAPGWRTGKAQRRPMALLLQVSLCVSSGTLHWILSGQPDSHGVRGKRFGPYDLSSAQ